MRTGARYACTQSLPPGGGRRARRDVHARSAHARRARAPARPRSLSCPPRAQRQDEVFELLHWMRQLMGLVGGVAWGYANAPGLAGFLG